MYTVRRQFFTNCCAYCCTSTTTPLKVSVAGRRREQEQACRSEAEESLSQHRSWESNIAGVFSIRSFRRAVVGAEEQQNELF